MPALFLVEVTIKATLVLLAAWAAARLLARASAASRHAVWAIGIVLVLALPLAVVVAPAWELPLPAAGLATSDAGEKPAPAAGPALTAGPPSDAVRPPTGRSAPAGGALIGAAAFTLTALGPAVIAVWALGAIVVLGRLAAGLLTLASVGRRAAPPADPQWPIQLHDVSAQLGVRAAPRLLCSHEIAIPAVYGVRRSTILLPPECDEWSPAQRRSVLLHELAHVKRRDCLVLLVAECARALFWFHPLIHLAASRLRDEREQAADDVVIGSGTRATDYAAHLVDLVRAELAVRAAPAAAMGDRSRLNVRVAAILDHGRVRTAPGPRIIVAGGLAAALALTILAGTRAGAQAPAPAAPLEHGGGVVTRLITGDTRQRAADALAAALRDQDEEIRKLAGDAIDTIRGAGDGVLEVRTPCRGACVNVPGLPALAQLVNDVRCEWVGGPVCDVFDLLESDDAEARRTAAGRIWPGSRRGAAALANALLDDDRTVRNLAAIRLDSVHAQVAVPNWIVLLGDVDPMLRERAAISLGVIGDARAIEPLGQVLTDPETAVRLQAAKALATIALGERTPGGGTMPSPAGPVVRIEDGATVPEIVREVRPSYTPAALQARVKGGVRMLAVVEPDGSVGDVQVIQSLDAEHGLDDEAVAALRRWAFKPGRWQGEPARVLVTVDMRFTLR